MAPTRDWATQVIGTPPGARDADEIDDSIREFKVDLNERLAGILVDVNAFPWVLVPLNTVTRIHYSSGYLVSSQIETVTTVDLGFPYLSPVLANGSVTLLIPIPVPVGQTLSKVRCRIKLLNVAASFTGSVKQVGPSGVATQIGFAGVTGVVHTSFTDVDTATSPTVAAAGDVFYIEAVLQNANIAGVTASFMDVEVTLNTPV